MAEKYYYCKNISMFWFIAGFIVVIAIIYSSIEELIFACKNTYRAFYSKEKIKKETINTYITIIIWAISIIISYWMVNKYVYHQA